MKKHCKKCGNKKSCGLHHVYVIELENEVLSKDKKFTPHFLDRSDTTVKCYYVGETKHRTECRYKQHVAKPSAKHFTCSCFSKETDEPKLRKFTKFNKGNKATKQFHEKGGLRPELFTHLNPIKGGKTAAVEAEKSLALSLRADGHAVHFN